MSFIDVSKCTLLILIWDWIPLPQDILPFYIHCMRIHDKFPQNKSYPEMCFCVWLNLILNVTSKRMWSNPKS